jgi:DNA/RNA endonuclease YhcR with UshA esterase domain
MDIATARTLLERSRVRVRGTVTAEVGRLVDDRTFVIQDETAAIFVMVDGGRRGLELARGSEIVTEGRLTSRYGVLEVRLDDDDPLDVVGSAKLPEPQAVQLGELGEATEALLVAASGVVTDIDTTKSGTTTIMLEDESGTGRVVAFAAAGRLPDGLARDATIDVTGIAGQRASAKGRLDGYRIWIRDAADIAIVAGVPGTSPAPGASPSPTPGLASIADARGAAGQAVVIEGVITSPAGLLDADGRRVTVEDDSGAILVRLADRRQARVGARIRVGGKVGTYYGGPQLSASGDATVIRTTTANPATLTKAPGEAEEWRLVRVRGTIVDVRRSGQSWRAELRLSGGSTVPIVGLERVKIGVGRVRQGATGSIVGIVRRPYPTATDRRFAVLPRAASDIDLTSANGPSKPSTTGGSGSHPSATGGSTSGAAATSIAIEAPIVEAGELETHAGRVVRIGGLVAGRTELVRGEPTVRIVDLSGQARLRLPIDATAQAEALRHGDLVEALGAVEHDATGPVVVVADPADLVVAGQAARDAAPSEHGEAAVSPTQSPSTEPPLGSAREAAAGHATPVEPLLGLAGAGGLLAVFAAVGAVAARRRRGRTERLFSEQAAERLVSNLTPTHDPRSPA